MPTQYENYITKNIKTLYKKRLPAPFIFLVLLCILCFIFPVSSVAFPTVVSSQEELPSLYDSNDRYVLSTVKDLKFTGYTKTLQGRTFGYYYYAYNKEAGNCFLVLLSPSTCEQGLPEIPSVTIHGEIQYKDSAYHTLLKNLSADLSWTENGILKKVSPYYLSEPAFHYPTGLILLAVFLGSGFYAVLSIVLSILYVINPVLSPPCRTLSRFGRPRELLIQAEEELATLPQLATEDMFITEHFFIETSRFGIAIVPIQEIVWIYKHSTLHKLFWYHFSISYTLNITANHHVYIHCPKNIKSDIDGIIDYLTEANHNILVGFSEKNRLKVQAMQGNPLNAQRLISFLKKYHPFHKKG